MPKWLERMLVEQGKLDDDGYSRRAVVRFCRSCGQPTIRGLDGPVAGLPLDLDVAALDNTDELTAVLAGRGTHRVQWVGGRYEIDPRRGPIEIAAKPAGVIRDVHARHVCGAVLGSVEPVQPSRVLPTTPTTVPGF